jgi:hypothetical protein
MAKKSLGLRIVIWIVVLALIGTIILPYVL